MDGTVKQCMVLTKPVTNARRYPLRAGLLGLSLWLLALACGACEKPSSRLIEIGEVTRDDDAQALSIAGSGFPAARVGQAQLTGTLYRAGAAPRSVNANLPCHALSDERLRVDLRSYDSDRFDNGLFEGKIELQFPSNAGSSEIVGAIDSVRIRFDRARNADLSADLLLARRARNFQRELGALEVETGAHGLVLTRIAQDSRLARAGVQEGDRIERIDGAPVERAPDLLPQDEQSDHTLEIARRVGGKRERIVIQALGRDNSHAAYLAACAFLVALAAGVLLPGSRALVSFASPAAYLAGAGMCAAAFVAFGLSRYALDVRLFYGLPVLACLTLLGFAFARRQLSGMETVQQVLRLSAGSLGLACLTILSGSLTNTWAGVSELAVPIRWTLLCAPPAWLALFVLQAARPSPQPLRYWSQASEWLAWTTAVCIVSLAAGGGTWPHAWPKLGASTSLAVILFALKVALLRALLSRLTVTLPRSVLGVCALLCPLAAWAFLSLSLRTELIAVFGAVGLGFWIARTLLARLGSQPVHTRDPALAPFL